MLISRTACWARTAISSPSPVLPTRASSGTGRPVKDSRAVSMPRMPLVRAAGRRSRPSPTTRSRSSRKAVKAPGPRSPVRATR
ncbi:hypothetical protein ACFYP4_00890 [Streptomyces sp. NPDC005551]|uniref:hypothetical protein n=1 Tax=Streptomyces sp. NPDC005551 TaxID=3364725 RepID=UPI00368496D7